MSTPTRPDRSDTDNARLAELYAAGPGTLAGAPVWSADLVRYAQYKAFPNETWQGFRDRIDMSFASAEAAIDVRKPIWEPSKLTVPEGADLEAAAEIADKAFSQADHWTPAIAHPLATSVMERLASLLPRTSIAPPAHLAPDTAEFVWATARCAFAGAGYEAHQAIVPILLDSFPSCPFSTDETRADWEKNLDDAHRNSGLPATLIWTRWKTLRGMPQMAIDGILPRWVVWRAWVHVLTHVRRESTDTERLRISYNGMVTRLSIPDSSTIVGDWIGMRASILRALGCPVGAGRKTVHPLTRAVEQVLNQLTVADLPFAFPVAALPPQVLAGSWSSVVPESTRVGFAEHGLRLLGVRFAHDGVVDATDGDDDDILDFEWNVTDPHSKENRAAYDRFVKTCPKTYEAAWPADILLESFPNLVTSHHGDAQATMAMMDLVIFTSLMRDQVPEFDREFPLFCVMPSCPTGDDSTNQGKTLFCEVYGKAMQPMARVKKGLDSSSAPDMRAVAEELRNRGTAILDEWYPPINKGHLLSRDNLQTLCTGGEVLVGKVLENTTGEVKLRHSLVISSKALDFAPDMVNRSLFWFLDNLSDAQRDRPEILEAAMNGTTSLRMRLGAQAIIDQVDLVGLLQASKKASGKWRFGCHRALGELLYLLRCKLAGVTPKANAIDQVILEMQLRHDAHVRDADESGLLVSLAEGRSFRVRLSALFNEISGVECSRMADHMMAHGPRGAPTGGSGVGGCAGLLRAWLALREAGEQPLAAVLKHTTGRHVSVSDRSVCIALGTEIRRALPPGSGWRMPGLAGIEGWVLARYKDHSGAVQVAVRKLAGIAGVTSGELVILEDPP